MQTMNGRRATSRATQDRASVKPTSAIPIGGEPLAVATDGQPDGEVDHRFGAPPAEGRHVEDIEVAGATVGIVDDGEQPSFIVVVTVDRSNEEGFAGRAPRTRAPRPRPRHGRGRIATARRTKIPLATAGSARGSRHRRRRGPMRSRRCSRGGRSTLAQGVRSVDTRRTGRRPAPARPGRRRVASAPTRRGSRRSPSARRRPVPRPMPTVDGLAQFRHAVAAHVEDDGAVAVRFVVRPEHMGHQAGIESNPLHAGPVAPTRHHAQPAFGPGHPSEGHCRAGALPTRQRPRGR